MKRSAVAALCIAMLVAIVTVAVLSGPAWLARTAPGTAMFHPARTTLPARHSTPAVPPRARPLVFGHRGGVERAHENTMAAFNDAISIGVDYIETDVRHSSDGVAFLIHDPALPRACTPYQGREIRSLTAAQLAQVTCAGQPIPRLSDLVTRLRQPDAAQISVFPEVKDVDPLGVRDILAPLSWSRVIVQSSDYAALEQIKQASPQVRTCPLIWAANGLDPALAVTGDCVAPEYHLVTADLVARAHAAGAIVIPFTVDDPAAMRRLVALGADGVITDRPRVARQTLRLPGQLLQHR
ncbi:glycerophosphodiester phosphodiesterase [Planosporangium sp. 12N6]|uniref:glycerophosphodiester phosphodiesterase n=1 Tax=Planosporangium spinosum TaxID=3402278 RepID=UPI003CF77A43